MKKRILITLLSAVMLVGCLAGCGGDGDGGETASRDLVIMDSEWYGIDTLQLDSSSGAQFAKEVRLFISHFFHLWYGGNGQGAAGDDRAGKVKDHNGRQRQDGIKRSP